MIFFIRGEKKDGFVKDNIKSLKALCLLSTVFLCSLILQACGGGEDGVPSMATPSNCPGGYIEVPGNAVVGAPNNFCVMKYEAKNDGNGSPTSTAETSPWVSINQVNAKAVCTSLGTGYDLISNSEWMTIARNVENVASNWTGGAVGTGCLKRGNTGTVSPCEEAGYDGADPESGASRNALASLTLNNNEVIWDLSGNVWEWVDRTLGGELSTDMAVRDRAYVSTDNGPADIWVEFSAVDMFSNVMPAEAMLPENPNYNAAQGVGRYLSSTVGGAALRGGYWDDGSLAGAFSLNLLYSSTLLGSGVGFRCVFRDF